MSEELKLCPFCGAGETIIDTGTRVWLGTRYSEPSSVSVKHWCDKIEGQPSRIIERIGRDEQSAVAAWNRRATTTPAVERTHENKPNPDLDKECSHKFEPFKQGLCICEICYQVRPAVKKEASIPCVHVNEPKACYRVRCQLGNKCVDDDMSPRAESENRSTGICFFCSHPIDGAHEEDCPQAATGICFFCSHPIDGAHEEDCPQAAATAPDRHSILYEAGEALLAAEHHEAYEVLYRMMEECRAISLAAAPPAVEKEASGEALILWRAICEEAEAVIQGGKKYLMLNEEMCIRLGGALEDASPAMGDSALEVLRTLVGFMADIELPDELRKSKELADAYATIRGTVGDSAGEPVATLHDDGYWTWKKGAPPYKSNYAGWRMDVYAHPPAQTADVWGMTGEQIAALQSATGLMWGMGKHDAARALRSLLEQPK